MSGDTSRTRHTTRVWVPHPQIGIQLAGNLEKLEAGAETLGRKLALILHGTMGHKDYLFHKRLAKALPIDSFRFDFRGSNESDGTWKFSGLAEDLEDLQTVVRYITKKLGYVIDLIVGHSRGSIVGLRWMCTAPEAAGVRGFVNVSGRYRMERIHVLDAIYKPHFESQGYYEWKVNVARKSVVGIIYPDDLDKFAAWDASLVWDRFPTQAHALTIHGMKDHMVPPYDAMIYARALGSRTPGTHNLHYIEDGDHNLSGHYEEVVETVLKWWSSLEQGNLQTGIWNTGVRGKL